MTIITVVLNNRDCLEACIQSVLRQTYPHIEYIVVDGGSTDGTLEILGKYDDGIAQWISEPDRGMYDAMNKGIRMASGEVIGILNSDDVYAGGGVIARVVHEFQSRPVDSVFGDLTYFRSENPEKIVRYYRSANFHPGKFAYGWMPPHPTFFVKRKCYEKYGLFKTDYRIAADFELLVRFLAKCRVTYSHIPEVMVRMRSGGRSTRNLTSNWILNREIIRACRENEIKTNYLKIYSKYLTKVFQFIGRPK